MNTFSSSKPSLIPYLGPSDGRFSLELCADSKNGDPGTINFPFPIVSTSDPLALILNAVIKSNADSTIGEAFLLLEKDEYTLQGDAVWPINNNDINNAWQDSFSLLLTQDEGSSLIILKEQTDDNHNLQRWQPLFYCRKKALYFHPSCPKCGTILDLCQDDDLLIKNDLKPYSSSIKKYLYCTECQKTDGNPEFYVHSRDPQDPSSLKDQKDLIMGFGKTNFNNGNKGGIPCPGCSHLGECYESGDLSLSRISPISFYPFFMLLLKAPTINLLDFLPLISGAKVEEITRLLETKGDVNRAGCLKYFETQTNSKAIFLFEEDPRIFLEILYLKLSLLGELAQEILSDLERWRHPDFVLSLDRVWVKMSEQNPLLPLMWNFRLRHLGIGSDSSRGLSLPKLPPDYGLYLLGSIWFYVLLTNNRNSIQIIHEQVADVLENPSSDADASISALEIDKLGSAFAPENIFWDPVNKVVNSSWQTFWCDAVNFGFLLLRSNREGISNWSEEAFWEALTRTRENIKKTLFQPESLGSPTHNEADKGPDKGIYKILKNIHNKWQKDLKGAATDVEKQYSETASEAADPLDDVIKKETVLLKPGEFKGELQSLQVSQGDTKKVRISSSQPIEKTPEVPTPPEPEPEPEQEDEEDLPKTTIMKIDASHGEDVAQNEVPVEDPAEDDIPETVIISTKDIDSVPVETGGTPAPGGDVHSAPPDNKSAKMGEDEEDIPETVIIKIDDKNRD